MYLKVKDRRVDDIKSSLVGTQVELTRIVLISINCISNKNFISEMRLDPQNALI